MLLLSDLTDMLASIYKRAGQAAVKTWPGIIAFLVVMTVVIWIEDLADWARLAIGFVGFALCSAMIYRAMLQENFQQGWISHWARQIAAHGLTLAFLAMVAFILSLFLIIVSVILVVASGYDPTVGDPADTTASLEALRASGAIWIMYTLLACALACLVWFALRLFLSGPATVSAERLLIFRTWSWAKGKVVRFGIVTLLAFLPVMVLAIAIHAALPLNGDSALGAFIRALVWMPPIYALHGAAVELYSKVPTETRAFALR